MYNTVLLTLVDVLEAEILFRRNCLSSLRVKPIINIRKGKKGIYALEPLFECF